MSTVSAPRTVDVWQVLDDPRTPRSTWSISDRLAVELTQYLERRRPARILEIGSGLSTVVLGAYAVRHGAAVTSLEHAWNYYRRTQQALAYFGMDTTVKLKLAPLRSKRFESSGRRAPWYDTPLDGEFDFVFVDGPPKAKGRNAVLLAIAGHLADGWELWLDDAYRHHERNCLRRWQRELPKGLFRVDRRDVDGKGLLVLSDASRGDDVTAQLPRRPQLGRSLGIALTVNGDSTWPRRVERCLGRDLLSSSLVVATAAADGPADLQAGFVDRWVSCDAEAFNWFASQAEIRYVLRLDDHWRHATVDETWFPRALKLLDERSDVELVSLRHRIDTDDHRDPDEAERGFVELGEAAFPDGPGLFRATAMSKLVPTDPGRERCPPWRKRRPEPPAGIAVQLFPGVFRRMGDNGRPSAATRPPAPGR